MHAGHVSAGTWLKGTPTYDVVQQMSCKQSHMAVSTEHSMYVFLYRPPARMLHNSAINLSSKSQIDCLAFADSCAGSWQADMDNVHVEVVVGSAQQA